MPTVLVESGFTVVILLPPREHGPPHVHVRRAGAEVIVLLDPVGVHVVRGMRDADVVKAVRIVEAATPRLLSEWRRYHG